MSQETSLLEIVNSCCFGCVDMDSIYQLSSEIFIILIFFSILISSYLHKFYNKTHFKISNEDQIDIIEVKKYSLATKSIAIFFILVLFTMPIFKLLNTGYFL